MNKRQQRILVHHHTIHVYSTHHFSPYTPCLCLRVWARGDVSLLISSDTTLLTPQLSDKRFPDPALSRHRQLTRLFPVWAASEPASDQPGYTGVTRVSRLRQSIADSQTCHCSTNTHDKVSCKLSSHSRHSLWSALSSVEQVWTCWAWNKVVQFTPQRQLLPDFREWTRLLNSEATSLLWRQKNKNCE